MSDITEIFLSNFKEYRNYNEDPYIRLGIVRNGNKAVHITMEGLDEQDSHKWNMQVNAMIKVTKDKIYVLPLQMSGKRKAKGPWYAIHPLRMKNYVYQGFQKYLCRFIAGPTDIVVFDVSNKKNKQK